VSVPSQRHISDSKQTVPYQSDYQRLNTVGHLRRRHTTLGIGARATRISQKPQSTHTNTQNGRRPAPAGTAASSSFGRCTLTVSTERLTKLTAKAKRQLHLPFMHASTHHKQMHARMHADAGMGFRDHGARCNRHAETGLGRRAPAIFFFSRRKLGAK
jgi:hypothetical protein